MRYGAAGEKLSGFSPFFCGHSEGSRDLNTVGQCRIVGLYDENIEGEKKRP